MLPEPWKFKRPSVETKNQDTPILERYIHTIFRKQGIDFNSAKDEAEAARYFHVENECACFHTGLYTGALIAFVAIDYITGVMCAVIDHRLSSEVGFKGIFKKVLIFLLVGTANILDVQVIGTGCVLRTAVIFFYISNEGVSLLENAAYLGLPVPEKIKTVLEQLHSRSESEDK